MTWTNEERAYYKKNTTRPADVETWMTFSINHIDFSEEINLVAIENFRAVESDLSIYTFEGVTYKPVSMSVSLPRESIDSNGDMTITFPRIGSEVKRRMESITPAHRGPAYPISVVMKQYQSNVTAPVKVFNGSIGKGYPTISNNDVTIKVAIYNPSMLLSQSLTTVDKYPELANV